MKITDGTILRCHQDHLRRCTVADSVETQQMEVLEEEIVEAFDQLISTKSRDHSNMDAVALEQVPIVH